MTLTNVLFIVFEHVSNRLILLQRIISNKGIVHDSQIYPWNSRIFYLS